MVFSNWKVVTNSGVTRNYVLCVLVHSLSGDQYAFRIRWACHEFLGLSFSWFGWEFL